MNKLEVLVKLQTTEKLIIHCFYVHVALFISHPQVHCQFVCVDAVLGRFYFVFISLFRARTKRTLIGNFRCKESGRESAPLAVHSCGLSERDGEKERAAHGLLLLGVGWPGFG